MSADEHFARPWSRIEADDGTLLRRPRMGDVPGVFAVHSDPAVYAHDPQEVHADAEYSSRFLEPMLEHWNRHGFGYWAILIPTALWPDGVPGADVADGHRVFAGLGGIQHRTIAEGDILNVYYRLATPAQGQGIARTLLQRVLATAPIVAPGVDVVVRTRPGNVIARHVAERAGFTDEGLEPGTTDMQLLRRSAPQLPRSDDGWRRERLRSPLPRR